MDIAGTVALVTGASSGIGAATAEALARRGATVVLLARRADRLAEVAARCEAAGVAAVTEPADVADRAAVEAVVGRTQDRFGHLDIVVNNAGISLRRHAAHTTVEDIERVLRINFLGAVYTTMAALPGMLDRGRGAIINVTSVAGYIPNPHESAYGASKAALSLWSHGLAVDLAGSGVHVGVVSPGPIDTEIWHEDEEPAAYEGKLYPPEVVARAIVRSIERQRVHITVPRQFGFVGATYPLFGRAMRWGLVRFQRRADRRTTSR